MGGYRPQPFTVGDILRYLEPADWAIVPTWPPTAFGIVATLLRHSGGYIRAVNSWPPSDSPDSWCRHIRTLADQWRHAAVDDAAAVPNQVQDWWDAIVTARDTALDRLCDDDCESVCKLLLEILAVADEASAGVGLPKPNDKFEKRALTDLAITSSDPGGQNATLCRDISRSRFTVLPKLHTPQTGITIRSLSHHLALCPGSDVSVRWETSLSSEFTNQTFNLLLFPWPFEVEPSQFRPAANSKGLGNLAAGYCFFEYSPSTENPAEPAASALGKAESRTQPIDCMVLPELAVDRPQYEALRTRVFKGRENLSLISGVADGCLDKRYTRNYAVLDTPALRVRYEQDKHHRWKLDENQIDQYGLDLALERSKQWWESCWLTRRSVTFLTLRDWLTICVVVCEDLARPDPLSEVIRNVGPNLVIAILMDGPQLTARWSARYAAALADDPGSSVLTVTSLGMSLLSRQRDRPKAQPKRTIGLWRDSSITRQLELAKNKSGLILELVNKPCEEWTADGRGDGGTTGRPVLVKTVPV
jgi:hypothetical protein